MKPVDAVAFVQQQREQRAAREAGQARRTRDLRAAGLALARGRVQALQGARAVALATPAPVCEASHLDTAARRAELLAQALAAAQQQREQAHAALQRAQVQHREAVAAWLRAQEACRAWQARRRSERRHRDAVAADGDDDETAGLFAAAHAPGTRR